MLARVADSLYWIGRNLERAEHCSRFLKVQYFSTLDTPMIRNKDFVLRSIMFMAGSNVQVQGELVEREVWKHVIFDINNAHSIFSMIKNARENARSIRNTISTELWESINKFYLVCTRYDEHRFSSSGLFAFSEEMKSHIAMIKSAIRNSILHDDAYHFISMGMFIERALQVLRIVRGKISDWSILSENGVNKALISYQWTILLKSIEGFDIYNTLHPGKRNRQNIFKLIFNNELFPRSITYSIKHVENCLSKISVKPEGFEEFMTSFDKDLEGLKKFSEFDDEDKILQHTNDTYNCLTKINNDIANLYFY